MPTRTELITSTSTETCSDRGAVQRGLMPGQGPEAAVTGPGVITPPANGARSA
ncbi:hypothetical protein [Streptomyces lydicus]|uniref:hypothetical protein n=1 Tax=Streptomyces lydicus TaxID=47763 RepID=UPI0013E945C9|nr:hypothetical protein [Streptomyces lydicus]MCZ1011673.1 hypothetical protein [Streptomyces lydicus]